MTITRIGKCTHCLTQTVLYERDEWCKGCRKEVNARNNTRNNHIKRWAKLLSGLTSAELYKLDKPERVKWLRLARDLVASGSSYVKATMHRKTRKDGVLYVIAHPNLTGYKVGRAFDADSRLANYQTGCPQRQYTLKYVSPYITDCVEAEKQVFDLLEPCHAKGEWYIADLTQVKFAIFSIISKRNSYEEMYSNDRPYNNI